VKTRVHNQGSAALQLALHISCQQLRSQRRYISLLNVWLRCLLPPLPPHTSLKRLNVMFPLDASRLHIYYSLPTPLPHLAILFFPHSPHKYIVRSSAHILPPMRSCSFIFLCYCILAFLYVLLHHAASFR